MDERESALPNNTAPGGHTCPTCYDQIIPPTNLISPVADVLRARLKKTTWGRDEFVGTSVLDHSNNKPNSTAPASNNTVSQTSSYSIKQNLDNSSSGGSKPHAHELTKDHSINIEATAAYYQSKWLPCNWKLLVFYDEKSFIFAATSSRRPLLGREQPGLSIDRDENKYKRRTPAEIFSRWSR